MKLPYQEAGSGPALLLVHGFPLHAGMWNAQLEGLADIRRVVAVDLRGHGKAPLGEDAFSMDLFADDIIETIDALGLDQVDLGALSMGGYVAFALWRRHPLRVRSLLFMDTKAEADSEEAKAGRDTTAATLRADGMAAIWGGLGPKLLRKNPDPTSEETVRQIVLACAPEAAARDAIAMRDREDSTGTLSTITVPTLWLHGSEDQLMAADGARANALAISDCEFIEIPEAGHMAPLENPAAANDAIRKHLART